MEFQGRPDPKFVREETLKTFCKKIGMFEILLNASCLGRSKTISQIMLDFPDFIFLKT